MAKSRTALVEPTPEEPIDRDPAGFNAPRVAAPAVVTPTPAAPVVKPAHSPRLVNLALQLGITREEIAELDHDGLMREVQVAQMAASAPVRAAPAPSAVPAPPPPLVEEEPDWGTVKDESGNDVPVSKVVYPGLKKFLLAQEKDRKELRERLDATEKREQERNTRQTQEWQAREFFGALAEHPEKFTKLGEKVPDTDPRFLLTEMVIKMFNGIPQNERTDPRTDAAKCRDAVLKVLGGNVSKPAPRPEILTDTQKQELERDRQLAAATAARKPQPRAADGTFTSPTVDDYIDSALAAPTARAQPEAQRKGVSAAIEDVAQLQRERGHYVRPNYNGDDLEGIRD